MRIGIVLLALIVLVAVLWSISRVRGGSPEQRAALELFEQMPEPSGRNAWPLAWLLQWDVPASEVEAVAAEDAARFNALPPFGDAEREAAVAALESVAAGRYRDLGPTLVDGPASCGLGGGPGAGGCLAHVRDDRDAHAARLAGANDLVDRVEALADYDHMYSLISPVLDARLPRLQWLGLPTTRHALWFVDGEHDRALAGSCRAITGYRRLATNSDTLLFSTMGFAVIGGQSALLAEMLAELPVGHVLPGECDEALAPLQPEELGTCRAMRGEWAWGAEARNWMAGTMSPGGQLVYDPGTTDALIAAHLAWPCSDEAGRLRAQDLPVSIPELPAGLGRLECWANLVGCVLSDIAAPAYVHYEDRALDAAAKIRLLQTLAWMREQASAGDIRDVPALLARSPHLPQEGDRSFEVGPDGTHLRMSLSHMPFSDDGRQTHWTIPLPPELHVTAAAH
ncbi:hypothetical protein ACW7G2_08360 [Luteimonas sp. A277]